MAMYLKQSTSTDVPVGPFLDDIDGKTAETALTITQPDVRLKKGAAAWAQKAAVQTLLHEENGWYEVTLDATDTDTIGPLMLAIHETGALPVWREFHVLAANVYDSLFGAATDKLDVNVEEWNATAVPAEHTAGYPVVTVKDGTGTGEINTNAGAVALVDLTTTTTTATNVTTVNGLAANVITATSIAADAIGASELAADAVTKIRSIVSGTADSGTTTTMVDAALTEADTDYWKGSYIVFTSGTLLGQTRLITGFTPATDTMTFSPATTVAVSTHTYEILPNASVDLQLWAGVAPNALVSGRMDSSVGAMAANVLTATAINGGAITATKFASDAIDSTVLASGAITASKFAAGAIDAAAIAVDAIGASELAASAVTEIQAGLSTLTLTQLRTALGTTGSDLLAELAQAAPAASPSLGAAIMLLYMALRNLHTSTATVESITNDAGTVICKATLSDDATTFSKAELVTGP